MQSQECKGGSILTKSCAVACGSCVACRDSVVLRVVFLLQQADVAKQVVSLDRLLGQSCCAQ